MSRPVYLKIGTPVLYTHRGCGVVWHDDVKEGEHVVDHAHWNWSTRDKRFAPPRVLDRQPSRPSRRGAYRRPDPRPLDRWVHVWPEIGIGYVVGLAFRSEGWRETDSVYYNDWGGEVGRETYLHEVARFPLYEIRRDLRAKPILVPVWAVDIDKSGHDWMDYELRRKVAA